MPGKRGKRATAPEPCADCKQEVDPKKFMRTKDGDFHERCWWKRYFPNSVHAK